MDEENMTTEEEMVKDPESIEPGEEIENDENMDDEFTQKKKGLWERMGEMGTVQQKEVVEFTRHLAVMLSSGITIFEAVTFLQSQTKNKVLFARLGVILESLNNGQSLSSSMKRFPKIFPEIYTNIVGVGEQSGTLPETMIDLAEHLEESERFKKKVGSAMIYPKIIGTVMILFLGVLFFFVMPRILTIFNSLNAEIPPATKFIIWLTDFMKKNVIGIVATAIGIVVGNKMLFKNKTAQKKRDFVYLKIPVVKRIMINYNTAQVAQHFGTLFNSGLTIVKCLEITASVIKNQLFQDEVSAMVEKIKKGSSLSQSFLEKTWFPPMFIKLIKVGERTGKLSYVVNYMKDYYKELVDGDVKNISVIIEPVVMVLLGLMVAGLVVTVIGPIYQLISNVSQ